MQEYKSGLEVTVYLAIVAPPLETGGIHDTPDDPVAADEGTEVAVTDLGEPGTVAGTAGVVGNDMALVPAEFVAVTVNV